jgi:hypothetical protein
MGHEAAKQEFDHPIIGAHSPPDAIAIAIEHRLIGSVECSLDGNIEQLSYRLDIAASQAAAKFSAPGAGAIDSKTSQTC